ncbi:hypothetical protein [Thalassotalea ganghwensis]
MSLTTLLSWIVMLTNKNKDNKKWNAAMLIAIGCGLAIGSGSGSAAAGIAVGIALGVALSQRSQKNQR